MTDYAISAKVNTPKVLKVLIHSIKDICVTQVGTQGVAKVAIRGCPTNNPTIIQEQRRKWGRNVPGSVGIK
jgi:hypothetical protein